MPTPTLSVILPVRDGAAVIGACLDHLAAQTQPDVEVVVVDNGSADGTGDRATRHPLAPTVVREPTPGSYAARNAGIAAASAPILAFTDVDCRPDPDWAAAGLGALAAADLAGGRIVQAWSEPASVWERYDAATYLDQADLIATSGIAATANLFVRRDVVAAVGPFRADLQSSGDLEFCRRATAAGFRLVYAPQAVVRHAPRRSARDLWRLHRRLGAGWAALARDGDGPAAWRDPRLRVPPRLGGRPGRRRRPAAAVPPARAAACGRPDRPGGRSADRTLSYSPRSAARSRRGASSSGGIWATRAERPGA